METVSTPIHDKYNTMLCLLLLLSPKNAFAVSGACCTQSSFRIDTTLEYIAAAVQIAIQSRYMLARKADCLSHC